MTRPPAMPDEDYEAIEAAVMDTARGRWFLAEFARRNRTADTSVLLTAIERLESMLAAEDRHMPPKPHEPPADDERATSAKAELFAIEHVQQPRQDLPLPSVPNDVAWLEDETAEEPKFAPPNVFELEDEDLTVPPPPPAAYQAPEPAPSPRATAQSSMLVAALAQAEQIAAEVTEPVATGAPPMTTSPPAADPAELDALSFEEKSVYFA
jgi:hypothetical protein